MMQERRPPMSFTHGAIWWSELMTRDVPAAIAYYRNVCGWHVDEMPMDDGTPYFVAVAHGKAVAGIVDMSRIEGLDSAPPHWFTYIAVDDVGAAVSATIAAGGSCDRPPFDVPGVGRIAIVHDPGGAPVGLMTPVSTAEPGGDGADPDLENVPV